MSASSFFSIAAAAVSNIWIRERESAAGAPERPRESEKGEIERKQQQQKPSTIYANKIIRLVLFIQNAHTTTTHKRHKRTMSHAEQTTSASSSSNYNSK